MENVMLECLRKIIIHSAGYQCSKKTRKGKVEGKKLKSRRKKKRKAEEKNPPQEMENQSPKKIPKAKKTISLIFFTHSFHCLRILYKEFKTL